MWKLLAENLGDKNFQLILFDTQLWGFYCQSTTPDCGQTFLPQPNFGAKKKQRDELFKAELITLAVHAAEVAARVLLGPFYINPVVL